MKVVYYTHFLKNSFVILCAGINVYSHAQLRTTRNILADTDSIL